MRSIFTIIATGLLFINCGGGTISAKESVVDTLPPNYDRHISIMFGGDVMFHQPQIDAGRSDGGEYDFSKTFQYVEPSWSGCDAVIFNLETTLSESRYSGYPQFAAPKSVAQNLKSCGVTHLVRANNHVCDKFATGVATTSKFIEEAGIESVGAYIDSLEWRVSTPHFIRKDGFKIALLNYTYGTNGIPVPKGMVIPHLDTVQIAKDIAKAQRAEATNIIVFVHWGYEYQSQPSVEQRRLAKWMRGKGVDVIIGSHPHVVQPIEADSCGVVVYSMGNFVSNQRKRRTNGGLLVKLDIVRNTESQESSYTLAALPHFVYKAPLGDSPRYYCLPEPLIDSIIKEPQQRAEARLFFEDTRALLGTR